MSNLKTTKANSSDSAAKKDIQKLQRVIVDALEDVKAQELKVFDTEQQTAMFERVIIASGTPNGFQTTAFSFNLDYAPVKNAFIRLEARTLNSKDNVFAKGNAFVNTNSFITASIAVSF